MPYDPEQAARQRQQQRQYDRESAGRAKSATRDPRQSSGGGGFQRGGGGFGGGPTIKPGPDPTFDAPAGTSKGVIHSEAQEQGVRSKVAAGKPLTQEDL